MTAGTAERTVRLDDLRVGELLAEGGEGRVFELPTRPHLVFKAYRKPPPRRLLDDLVAWPDAISRPDLAARVRAAASWPEAVVVDGDRTGGEPFVAGVLIPRAPRRFAVRHREGTTRLASLSYLTADPAYRAVAYGIALPAPVGPERLGLVYALARLLEACELASPRVGHGDLSTKNVLWSLTRGPEVFVIDCDNCERFSADGRPLTPAGRRRPMTPNWDDPAVAHGSNPGVESDCYSLALIFLRVVGAANFPIQARQRQGGAVKVDFAVPSHLSGEALLKPGAPVWDLCQRGLSIADPAGRPPASAWVAALEAVLDSLGAASTMRSVWAAQGGGQPSPAVPEPASAPAGDVLIRPVRAVRRATARWTMVAPDPQVHAAPVWHRPQAPPPDPQTAAPTWGSSGPPGVPGVPGVPGAAPAPAPPVRGQLRAGVRQALAWWLSAHRQTLRSMWAPGRRASSVPRLAAYLVVDVLAVLFGLFLVAMIVSPFLGI